MKRIDRCFCASRVIRMMVIAVAAVAVCLSITHTSSAQSTLPVSLIRTVERMVIIDSRSDDQHPVTRSGVLNLDAALKAEVRQFLNSPLTEPISDSLRPKAVADPPALTNDEGDEGKKIPDKVIEMLPDHTLDQDRPPPPDKPTEFQWPEAMKQSMIFLGIQHAFRLSTEQGTRADLKGPFFKDYLRALKSLRGWGDGDPFIVNYIGHPMMGAVSGFIQVQNDPGGINEQVGFKKSYWKSRLRALGWSAAYSTQFELGLISEASLGNIGIRSYGKSKNPMSYVDLVVTPVVGTGWLVGEDALDRYLIRRLENKMPNKTTLILFRSFLNPTRSFANILRGKWPWFRDNRK